MHRFFCCSCRWVSLKFPPRKLFWGTGVWLWCFKPPHTHTSDPYSLHLFGVTTPVELPACHAMQCLYANLKALIVFLLVNWLDWRQSSSAPINTLHTAGPPAPCWGYGWRHTAPARPEPEQGGAPAGKPPDPQYSFSYFSPSPCKPLWLTSLSHRRLWVNLRHVQSTSNAKVSIVSHHAYMYCMCRWID